MIVHPFKVSGNLPDVKCTSSLEEVEVWGEYKLNHCMILAHQGQESATEELKALSK